MPFKDENSAGPLLSYFIKCSVAGCPNLVETFRDLKICDKHYFHQDYKRRRALAMKYEPGAALQAIGVCLKKFKELRDGGILHQSKFTSLQHDFLTLHQQLISVADDDYDTQEMAEAEERYVKRLLARGAVVAESEEEAKRLLEERQKPKLTEGEKKEEEKKEED